MRQCFPGVLDIYRFALAASRIGVEDRTSLEIAEQVFLDANSSTFFEVADHLAQFKRFLAAIDRTRCHKDATHILHYRRSTIVEKFKDAVDDEPFFPLVDFTNGEIESRFRLSEIDPYLSRSLIASAIDHSAESFWQFLSDLPSAQFQGDSINVFFDVRSWDDFDARLPLFRVGELININSETSNV